MAAGLYNLATAGFAIPHVFPRVYAFLNQLNQSLGLGGTAAEPPRDPMTQLLVNTAGLMLCLVGALLLHASRDLDHRRGIPLFNAVSRLLFAGLVTYYVVASDLPRVVIAMAAADLLFAGAFLVLLRNRAEAGAGPLETRDAVTGPSR